VRGRPPNKADRSITRKFKIMNRKLKFVLFGIFLLLGVYILIKSQHYIGGKFDTNYTSEDLEMNYQLNKDKLHGFYAICDSTIKNNNISNLYVSHSQKRGFYNVTIRVENYIINSKTDTCIRFRLKNNFKKGGIESICKLLKCSKSEFRLLLDHFNDLNCLSFSYPFAAGGYGVSYTYRYHNWFYNHSFGYYILKSKMDSEVVELYKHHGYHIINDTAAFYYY
jgi:hypothetical protein